MFNQVCNSTLSGDVLIDNDVNNVKPVLSIAGGETTTHNPHVVLLYLPSDTSFYLICLPMLDLQLYLLQILLLPDVLYHGSNILHFYLSRLAQGLTRRLPSLSSDSQDQRNGLFTQASNFSLSSTVFLNGNGNNASVNLTSAITSADEFMVRLLQETIPGVAFDSSTRDPPPRCHPETRRAILERCVTFVNHCTEKRKIRWVFGAAGVGKSAIMQSVVEHPLISTIIRASIFFFVDGRSDGSKAIVTLAYQLAVQCEPYRQFIKQEIAHDPSLLQKSMSAQFNKFIVEPFINPQLNSIGRVLIIIDGLNECDQARTQRQLLRLISDFCLACPSSPIVWMITSHPEPHIKSFFAQVSVQEVFEKEEVLVDSEEAREDVKRYLCVELKKIQNEFLSHSQARWLSDEDFTKLADASGGLFAFAHTAVKYIGDPNTRDPTTQLDDVLWVIDAHPPANVPSQEHPMALLDALYSQILEKIPTRVMENARNLLLALAIHWEQLCDEKGRGFAVLCNWLGMTCEEAYAAIRHLSPVLYVSRDEEPHSERLRYFHRSFLDYLFDYARSRFSLDIKRDARQLFIRCRCRILKQAPDDIGIAILNYNVGNPFGERINPTRGSDAGHGILLTWPVEKGSDSHDELTRFHILRMAFITMTDGPWRIGKASSDVFFLRYLAAHLGSLSRPTARMLSVIAFDQSRRQEFIQQGLLQEVPIQEVTIVDVTPQVHSRFRLLMGVNVNLPDPRESSCRHQWLGHSSNGPTSSSTNSESQLSCDVCYRRFGNQFEGLKSRIPDYSVLVLFTSAGIGIVEFRFVDPQDGISQWTYYFCHKFSEEERKRLGSTA